eukprot:SAG11_NODE_23880_length_381_cov_8.336879_1_plen_50_part_10
MQVGAPREKIGKASFLWVALRRGKSFDSESCNDYSISFATLPPPPLPPDS